MPVKDLGNIEDGQWHRVHVVSDGQTISYTFDGVQMSSLSLADGPKLSRFGTLSLISGSPAAPEGQPSRRRCDSSSSMPPRRMARYIISIGPICRNP